MAETYYKMMDNRVHDVEPMNDILYSKEKDAGGAPVIWHIFNNRTGKHLCGVNFQNGPRKAEGSVQGVKDEDLLEIVRARLLAYMDGDMGDSYTDEAVHSITAALRALKVRAESRKARGVLGTMER